MQKNIISIAILGIVCLLILANNKVEPTIPEGVANLAVIPDAWGQYNIFGTVKYDGDPQIIALDNNVYRTSAPSIRIDTHRQGVDPNYYREVNTDGIAVKPGDHVIFKVWVKTAPSTLGNNGNPRTGGLVGFDLYGSSGRLWEICPGGDYSKFEYDPAWRWQEGYQFVPYNTPEWTLRIVDFVIPDKFFTSTDGGKSIPAQQVSAIIAHMQMHQPVRTAVEGGSGWFADAGLYINP